MNLWQSVHGERYITSLHEPIYRMVESQSYIATRKLVDTLEEQKILEEEIEMSKPNAPKVNSRGTLDYLLFTPFRYPPLKNGGRFHTRAEQSIFYGSRELKTAMAEVVYRRFVFLETTNAELEPTVIPYTHFMVAVKSERAVLLVKDPFRAHRERISDPSSYAVSQGLGTAMRKHAVEAFTYFSARCEGINVGLFSPEVFEHNKPIAKKGREWQVFESEDVIEFRHHCAGQKEAAYTFRRKDFCVNGSLPVLK